MNKSLTYLILKRTLLSLIALLSMESVANAEALNVTYKSTMNNVIYDLSGRRVANPSNNIHVVKGKKVIITNGQNN